MNRISQILILMLLPVSTILAQVSIDNKSAITQNYGNESTQNGVVSTINPAYIPIQIDNNKVDTSTGTPLQPQADSSTPATENKANEQAPPKSSSIFPR
jgi:hypothetical protein